MKYAWYAECRVKTFFDWCLSDFRLSRFYWAKISIWCMVIGYRVWILFTKFGIYEKLVYYSVVVKCHIAYRKYLLNGYCLPDTSYQINEYAIYYIQHRTLRVHNFNSFPLFLACVWNLVYFWYACIGCWMGHEIQKDIFRFFSFYFLFCSVLLAKVFCKRKYLLISYRSSNSASLLMDKVHKNKVPSRWFMGWFGPALRP